MALIFVPAIAAIGFMVLSNLGGSVSGLVAALLFTLLALGVFGGMLRLMRGWEHDPL